MFWGPYARIATLWDKGKVRSERRIPKSLPTPVNRTSLQTLVFWNDCTNRDFHISEWKYGDICLKRVSNKYNIGEWLTETLPFCINMLFLGQKVSKQRVFLTEWMNVLFSYDLYRGMKGLLNASNHYSLHLARTTKSLAKGPQICFE